MFGNSSQILHLISASVLRVSILHNFTLLQNLVSEIVKLSTIAIRLAAPVYVNSVSRKKCGGFVIVQQNHAYRS